MSKFIDLDGLRTVFTKIKGTFLPLSGGTMSGTIKTDGNNIDFGGTGKAKNVYELTGERITLTSSDDETIQTLKVRNDRIDFLKDTDYKTNNNGTTTAESAVYITDSLAHFEVETNIQNNLLVEKKLTVVAGTELQNNIVLQGNTTINNDTIINGVAKFSGNDDIKIKLCNNKATKEDIKIVAYDYQDDELGEICFSDTNSYINFTNSAEIHSDSDLRLDSPNGYVRIYTNDEQRLEAHPSHIKIRNINGKNIQLDDTEGIKVCGDILLYENSVNCDHLPEDVTDAETTYLDNYLQNIIIDLKRRIETLEGAETIEETTE